MNNKIKITLLLMIASGNQLFSSAGGGGAAAVVMPESQPKQIIDLLWRLAQEGRVNELREVLESLPAGFDLNQGCGRYKRTPLLIAVTNNHVDVVRLLLSKGADVNAPGSIRQTVLIAAAFFGYVELVQLLLDAGADPHATAGFYGEKAVVYAIKNGHVEIVDLLLKKYANRDGVFPNDQGVYPNIEGDKVLVLSQENQYYEEGRRLVDIAVSLDYEEVCELLKKRGFK